jgi:cytochrome c oxidase cbb3-type subunit 3
MGPALMDSLWIYGSDPANIYATIVQGRPNGMPSFRGKISEQQIWQIVAYVRSLSGLVRADVAPSRSDELQTTPHPSSMEKQPPRNANLPPSTQQ